MSDPADKSDDLIAELARLMAVDGDKPGAPKPAIASVPPPVPGSPSSAAARPVPVVRIPGMDNAAPGAAAPASAAQHQSAPQPQPARAPVTGTIRIPGMDQPAPVSTSAPVSKFDFGQPVSAPSIPQEPLPSLAERIAARATETGVVRPAAPAPEAPRSGFDLRPVSENKSFAEGPVLTVNRPAAPPQPATPPQPAAPASSPPPPRDDFTFDFGFAKNPPVASPAPRPAPSADPIADLIAAETAGEIVAGPKPAPIPLKPVGAPPRASEDRFATSPGVGLNLRAQAGQPLAAPQPRVSEPVASPPSGDPMVEIENLIGDAVRVELTAAAPVRVQAPEPIPTPVHFEQPEADAARPAPEAKSTPPIVPPLSSPYAPRRSSLRDDRGTAAAEDAIMAAAATTGAKVNRIEPSVADESPYRRLRVRPQRAATMSSGVRQYVGMAVAGTLLLAAGLGLYWVLNMGGAGTAGTEAPQLTADATPVKEAAPSAPAADAETARSPVLEQLDGASASLDSEQLVPTDDQVALSTADAAAPRDVTDDTEGGLANRKVRTVTVRPDGTIVSGDDSVAGTEELPVDRPNVPAVPGTDSTSLLGTDRLGAGTDLTPSAASTEPGAATASTQPLQTAATSDVQPVFDSTIVAPRPISFPVRSASSAEPLAFGTPSNSVNALVGAQTPNGQIDLLAGGQSAPVAAAPRTTADTGSAAAYVQMASMPSQAEAQAQARTLTNTYGSLFGGADLIVQEADLGSMGVRYRVRLPTSSLNDATRICAEIKASGGDCFATSG